MKRAVPGPTRKESGSNDEVLVRLERPPARASDRANTSCAIARTIARGRIQNSSANPKKKKTLTDVKDEGSEAYLHPKTLIEMWIIYLDPVSANSEKCIGSQWEKICTTLGHTHAHLLVSH